jgi:hypothetical protein
MGQSHRIWQSKGSAAHVARFVEPPGGAGSIAGLPLRKQVALGRSWLFLQPNNSQCSNCQIRNTRTSAASVILTLGIAAERQADPSKVDVVTCSPVLSVRDQASATPSVAISDPFTGANGHEDTMRMWQLLDCFSILTSGVSIT